MVAISLGEIPVAACPVGDRDGDGSITIDEILAAIHAALNACAADLVPVSTRELPCPGGCAPQTIEVCVRNNGPRAAGVFGIGINGVTVGLFDGLASTARGCEIVPYIGGTSSSDEAVAVVDPENLVPEILESNNELRFPTPNPTACDIICDL